MVWELAVDRESVERVLEESPELLDTMLRALGESAGCTRGFRTSQISGAGTGRHCERHGCRLGGE